APSRTSATPLSTSPRGRRLTLPGSPSSWTAGRYCRSRSRHWPRPSSFPLSDGADEESRLGSLFIVKYHDDLLPRRLEMRHLSRHEEPSGRPDHLAIDQC